MEDSCRAVRAGLARHLHTSQRMKIDKILAATDFSETSEEAVKTAVAMGARLHAPVTVVHVYALPTYPIMPSGEMFVIGPEVAAGYLHGMAEQLKKLEARIADAGVRYRSVEGNPAETLVQIARDEGYDLIVMGTHGRTGLDRFLVGSVAERVVRTATVPVLTIRHAEKPAPLPFPVPIL